MKVVDNFLPEADFKLAQSLIMDYGFPWMWNDSVTKQVGESDQMNFNLFINFMILYRVL